MHMRPCLTVLALVGCNAPAWEAFTSYEEPSSSGVMTADVTPTTSGGGIMTTTVASTGSTAEPPASTGASTGEGSSTGEPPGPSLGEPTLTPNPLELPGPILVSAPAMNADAVEMQVDMQAPVLLDEVERGVFVGEILMLSALANGDHLATFTAIQGGLTESVEVPFVVALPGLGSELFWDSSAQLGQGSVAALVVLPSGEVVEFGTHYVMGSPRCYLRRRDQGGAWGPDDLVEPWPTTTCVAIDAEIDGEGALHLLASRTLQGETRWWLGKMATWAAAPVTLGEGPVGEIANALAIHPKMLAVCAVRPQPTLDVDAVAAIFRPNAPGEIHVLDYVPPMTAETHRFDETPRDCVFRGDTLTLVGEAYGKHEQDEITVRDRLFVLELAKDVEPVWTVAVKTMGMQSAGRTVVVDGDGRTVIGGYTCEDACLQRGTLWMHTPGVGFSWPLPLATGVGAIAGMAASAAGYVVVGSGKKTGPWEAAFWAEAWVPGEYVPKWTYTHDDPPALQLVEALAVGPYGQVYAGGVGAGGFPAIAYIGG